MKDFFISYTGVDRAWAEWIAFVIEEAGHTTIIQAWDFPPGSNFVLKTQEGAKSANRTITVLSSDYVNSVFAAPEWAAAFAVDPQGHKQKLVPVRVRSCDPEGLLSPIVYIDLVDLDEAEARKKLLDGVRQGRAKPADRPACWRAVKTDQPCSLIDEYHYVARLHGRQFAETLRALWGCCTWPVRDTSGGVLRGRNAALAPRRLRHLDHRALQQFNPHIIGALDERDAHPRANGFPPAHAPRGA